MGPLITFIGVNANERQFELIPTQLGVAGRSFQLGCGGEGEQMEDDTKEDDTTWDDFRCWPGTLHSVWVAMGPTA